MNINRNNYEEFFLLYIDGELSADQQKTVEAFAENNPDLKEELLLIQQTKLVDEDLVFDGKETLLRSLNNGISSANFEEKFLLYVDDELSQNEKEETETFVLQHPQHQPAFTLLKDTKLPIETIACPDKESLYKKEEKERPVIYMRFARMAVAAALIGFGVWGFVQYSNKNNDVETGIASKNATNNGNTNVATTQNPATTNNGKKNIETVVTKDEQVRKTYEQQQVASNDNTTSQKATNVVKKNENDAVAKNNNVVKENKTIIAPQQQLPVKNEPVIATAPKPIKDRDALIDKTQNNDQLYANNNTKATNNNAQQVVYKLLDTDEDEPQQTIATHAVAKTNTGSNNNNIYIGSAELDGKKLNKFFKKASRLLGNKNEDDNNVKVASFAISKSL